MSYAMEQDPTSEAGRTASLTRMPRAEGDETAAIGHAARVMRRPDESAGSLAAPAMPTRLHPTPEYKGDTVQVAAWVSEAGTSADSDTAGDVAGRYETRHVAAEHRPGWRERRTRSRP